MSSLHVHRGILNCNYWNVQSIVIGDEDDWREWEKVGDEILHIELRRWADALVIAPLSANTLAKMAQVPAQALRDALDSAAKCEPFIFLMILAGDVRQPFKLCGASLGSERAPAGCSCNEHPHVGQPFHTTALESPEV